MFQVSTVYRLREAKSCWHITAVHRVCRRRIRRIVFGALAVLLASSFSLALAEETRKPTRQLDEAPLKPRMTEGVQAVKARKPAIAIKIFDEIDRKFSEAYANGPRVYCKIGRAHV